MAIRLEQMHPSVVHVPITMLPLAVGADLVACLTGNRSLHSFARKAIVVAAAGAVASAVTGLIAGEEVNVEGDARDMLMTHRNMNFVATVVASCLALRRSRRDRPSALYLTVGAVGVGIVAYTAYLGGKIVYETGAGVAPAQGVYRDDAPRLQSGQVGEFLEDAATDLVHGVQHMVEEVAQGKLVPTIVASFTK
ncbi:MAG: DUF2231 domain-containing protein, partial [Gammaproteobacteria bacterium]